MRQQFKIQVARGTLSVEDSYVKWNEGPTSMDSSMEPEAVVQRTPDHSGDRRSIPPPGKVLHLVTTLSTVLLAVSYHGSLKIQRWLSLVPYTIGSCTL